MGPFAGTQTSPSFIYLIDPSALYCVTSLSCVMLFKYFLIISSPPPAIGPITLFTTPFEKLTPLIKANSTRAPTAASIPLVFAISSTART